jgi:hypothetical protein
MDMSHQHTDFGAERNLGLQNQYGRVTSIDREFREVDKKNIFPSEPKKGI